MVKSLRRQLYVQLEPRGWQGAGLSPGNVLITLLICVSAAIALVESEPLVYEATPSFFMGAEIVFAAIFAIEYATRLWVVGEDPRYSGVLGRLRYMRTPIAILDLLALLPVVVGALGSEAFLLRLFRLVRIVRLGKLGRYSTALTAILQALRNRGYELAMTVVFAGVLLVISSTLLYVAEGDGQQDSFGSIPRAMWWSIATLTTVGYGDAVPVTAIGRALAGLTALFGIGLIAMPAGILAAAFSDVLQERKKGKVD